MTSRLTVDAEAYTLELYSVHVLFNPLPMQWLLGRFWWAESFHTWRSSRVTRYGHVLEKGEDSNHFRLFWCIVGRFPRFGDIRNISCCLVRVQRSIEFGSWSLHNSTTPYGKQKRPFEGFWSHEGSPSHHGCFNTKMVWLDDLEVPPFFTTRPCPGSPAASVKWAPLVVIQDIIHGNIEQSPTYIKTTPCTPKAKWTIVKIKTHYENTYTRMYIICVYIYIRRQ